MSSLSFEMSLVNLPCSLILMPFLRKVNPLVVDMIKGIMQSLNSRLTVKKSKHIINCVVQLRKVNAQIQKEVSHAD